MISDLLRKSDTRLVEERRIMLTIEQRLKNLQKHLGDLSVNEGIARMFDQVRLLIEEQEEKVKLKTKSS